jgi:hypothetical protein
MRKILNFAMTGTYPLGHKRWVTILVFIVFSWLLWQKGCVLDPDIAPAQALTGSPTGWTVSASAMSEAATRSRVQRFCDSFRVKDGFAQGSTNALPFWLWSSQLQEGDGTHARKRSQ